MMQFSPRFGRLALAGVASFLTISSALAQGLGGAAAPSPTPTPAPLRTEETAVTPAIKDPNRHAEFLYRLKESTNIDLLFLSDSIMDGWPRKGEWTWLKFAPYKPADFGISGDRTEHVLWRIENGELDGIHPKVAIVMIGTNNIGNPAQGEKPEWAAAGVKKIVDTVHAKLPGTKVLLLGVFPRDAKDSPRRAATVGINEVISKYGDGEKTQYLDISSAFLDASGEIPKDIMADGLHPTAKGYEKWYDAMAPTLDKMMK